ncbi:Spy/CpxP family protein refolding chaperone [Halarcobacter ebronensis]|uniref:Periplasmic heavy metal sensor n=1 Tax=Halarcobacter ebronensis TaxID=1462615 RepID=A0A4Q1APP2_9BACT|nr:periplasmic heavy metal sensor [Halarcobacter ebronensis]QKF83519.1 hypothetical protein AEBR_3073 [Halarcobacter ebronensis]RXK08312.1 hypothetical protein CRV07_00465 [Halarcobacter ebronensis]
MKRLKILVVLCSLFLLTQLFASDHKYEHEYEEHNSTHIYKNLDYLQLSSQQTEEIKNILIKYRKKYAHYAQKRARKESSLKELFKKDSFDEKEYEEALEEIIEDEIELETKMLKKIHSVLSPKQREKFSYYLKEWRVE